MRKVNRCGVNCWLEPDVHDRLVLLAANRGQTAEDYVAAVIDDLVSELGSVPLVLHVDHDDWLTLRTLTLDLLGETSCPDLDEQAAAHVQDMVMQGIEDARVRGRL